MSHPSEDVQEPVCFRTCKFEMQDVQYFWLSDTPDKPGSSTWDNVSKPPCDGESLDVAAENALQLQTSIRMATMIKLLDKQTNENVYVVNTHLDDYGAFVFGPLPLLLPADTSGLQDKRVDKRALNLSSSASTTMPTPIRSSS